MVKKRTYLIVIFFFISSFSLNASGTYELTSIWDAETNAYLGGNIAAIDHAGALFINPAGIANINKMDLSLSFSTMIIDSYAPVNGTGTRVTNKSFFPLGILGFVYRLTDKLTAGLGFYTPSAGGATYSGVNFNIPGLQERDFKAQLYFLEICPTVAYSILNNFKIGFTYRVHYSKLSSSLYDVSDIANITYNETSLSGFAFSGYRLGIQYSPLDVLHIGLVYNNRVSVKTSGTVTSTSVLTNQQNVSNLESESEYADRITLGFTYEAIKSKLNVGFDIQYNLYSNYTNSPVIYIDIPYSVDVPEMTKNSFTLRLFSEYMLNENVPLRLGFSGTTKTANDAYHGILSTGAPAPSYLVAFGSGYNLDNKWVFDGSITLSFNKGTVDAAEATTPYAVQGDYKSNTYYLSLGVRYNL